MAPLQLTPTVLEDAMLPKMDHGDVADRLAILRIQEATTYHIRDYITDSAPYRKRASKPVDADCRIKMCEWCFQVVDFCKFRRETVTMGMSYLDRYLCTPQGRTALCNRKEYQLAAMTALYIAIKLHEPLEMETSLLADLSRGCYTEMEFVEMEQVMLQAIQWRVNGPTCLAFLAHFLALLPSSISQRVAEALMEHSRFQTEIAVAEQTFCFLRPSELALASVLNAMEGMDTALFPTKSRAKFIRYIERYSEMVVSKVEKVQSKLSYLLATMMSLEYNRIDPQVFQDWQERRQQESNKDGNNNHHHHDNHNNNNGDGRQKPERSSSFRKLKKDKSFRNSSKKHSSKEATSSKQKSPISVMDEATNGTTATTAVTAS
mmetsp:Transcript_4317/g.11842  ORF Transcript_4317/g.11842 Transcript_4317/m.11842 type:complete len:376 (-) Transcript_4317:214-1341(-)|eukprot:CAMPEP_0168739650 /NCGR_PEP_ID=MMETSP0724-20121128/11573_1 /TAXON_ID=265536 /ORGANISM="Amphiprora sp., Strain CCMP467" /LENGTH=375 /DNA_ID=CAMNT_0008787061 /DNA_START=332 /DNA_END=1459 /DNA_ORIENTATION=+